MKDTEKTPLLPQRAKDVDIKATPSANQPNVIQANTSTTTIHNSSSTAGAQNKNESITVTANAVEADSEDEDEDMYRTGFRNIWNSRKKKMDWYRILRFMLP